MSEVVNDEDAEEGAHTPRMQIVLVLDENSGFFCLLMQQCRSVSQLQQKESGWMDCREGTQHPLRTLSQLTCAGLTHAV